MQSALGPDAGTDVQLARYLANLAALYRRDAELAAHLDALPFAQTPPLEPTRDGNVTVRLIADDGKPIYAHSRYEPLAEARKFAEAQAGASARCGNSPDGNGAENVVACVVAGLGLGLHLPELARVFDKPRLVVLEDDLALTKAALCVTDLAELIASGRIVFVTRADKAALHRQLAPLATDMLLGTRFITLPHAARYHAAFQQRMQALLADFIAYAHMQMVTLLKNNRITFKNVAFNLRDYLDHPGVEVLRGRAAGFPAVIVAAGPSLARNIDLLPELREQAVIIAVQTVFKTLLARGVPPHFVTSLDFHELSAQFFHGVEDVRGCTLVAEPKATWHVLDAYRGRKHVLHSHFVDDLLRDAAPPRAALKAGSTVAHLAFYLAQHLGCDPIILIGQDLAYSDGLYYPPGMPIERIWSPELCRFQTIEMKQWERIVRARSILRVVKDIHGRDAYTDSQLYSYAEQFQHDFAAAPQRIIHACEGGMKLERVQVMTLREAAAQFCTRPLPANLFAPEELTVHQSGEPRIANRQSRIGEGAAAAGDSLRAAGHSPSRARAVRALEERQAELTRLRQIAGEMRELLLRLSELTDKPAEFNRLVARVDDLRSVIQEYDRTYRLVVEVSQTAELRRYYADRTIGEQPVETMQTARRRLRRDREFVDAFLDGCRFLESVLPAALERLRQERP